jgi:hypothetical protein
MAAGNAISSLDALASIVFGPVAHWSPNGLAVNVSGAV